MTLAATGLAALVAGCGSGNSTATKVQDQARKAQTQAAQQLSPQAHRLLGRAEALAGSVAATGKAYATESITGSIASHRLEGEITRAKGIATQAQDLPATDRSRQQIMDLGNQVAQSAQALREQIQTGKRPSAGDLGAQLKDLQSSAQSAYDRYRGDLPSSVRTQAQQAIEQLNGALSGG